MKKFWQIAIVTMALFSVASATAQTLALGERTPRIRKAKWLNGNAPEKCDFSYIEFIHSASIPCRKTAERLHSIISEFDNIAFVLVSNQKATEIDEWVTKYIDPRSGIVVDDSHIRTSFGVNYAPYAVIINSKRRALWFGNPQLLDRKTLEKLIQK